MGGEVIPGRLYFRGIHGLAPAELRDFCEERGIRTVILMTRGEPYDVAAALPPGTRYEHWPLEDTETEPVPDWCAESAARAAEADEPVLVMCRGGLNRSGLIAALIASRKLGIGGAEAVELVRAAREGALNNRAFAAYLSTA
jgi:protein-tyrosine phosphatase